MTNFYKEDEYPFIVKHLSEEDGGGYMVEYPDLPGCSSDGDTIEEAIQFGKDAVKAWIETASSLNRNIPNPGSSLPNTDYSGKYVQRLPKSVHEELSKKAKLEGVSINTLALTYISKGLGYNELNPENHN